MKFFYSQNFINGAFKSCVSQKTFDVVNPATRGVIGQAARSGAADVDLAVSAARAAFSGPWSQFSGEQRAALLSAIADGFERESASLSRLESLCCGKPLTEAEFDLGDVAGVFRFYAGLAAGFDATREEVVAVPDKRFRCVARREPMGVVGGIVPWNFPLLMLSWKVAPALAAGCCCVLKPSELTPFSALEAARIFAEAGCPDGVFNVINGWGREAGAALAAHPKVDKMSFTGSVPTGSAVMASSARVVRPVTLELGGKSPIVVFDDCDVDEVVEWVMVGVFFNQGEVCSSTSRLLLQRGIAGAVLTRLAEAARRLRVGDPLAKDTQMGPLVSAAQYEKVLAFLEEARNCPQTRVLAGGAAHATAGPGFFVQPTVLAEVPLESRLWREEIFGPVLCARTFDSEEEALALANDTEYGLAAAVLSNDEARAERVARRLQAGIVWVNCSQPTFSEAPWGGVKRSGIGRELGKWGLDAFVQVKQITKFDRSEPWDYYLQKAKI